MIMNKSKFKRQNKNFLIFISNKVKQDQIEPPSHMIILERNLTIIYVQCAYSTLYENSFR